MSSSASDRSASRRSLIRRAAVTGGAAVAATAVSAVNATQASADTGDPVGIGQVNEGWCTTITNAAPDGAATLVLQNDVGASLHLKRQEVTRTVTGGVYPTTAGLGVIISQSGQHRKHETLTTANATMLVPIPPTRVLDTRSPAGRARLLEGGGRIDSQGRATAGTFLVVHLRDIVNYGDGMIGNITVAKTEKAGFGTVFGRGDLPDASTINWFGPGQLLSNGVITQLGSYETAAGEYYEDVVAIYVQKSAAAVILDVTGLLVFHPESAVINNPKTLSGGDGVRAQVIKENAERGKRAVQAGA
ncbi:hypothetical protein [Micromonospora sp. KC213]|uniref:hypothetical protein n=1 Tax=Micromonospora sp. KC213 TaxID=2530378 RepID=UPI0010537785|nr:hypothetical protein [Micromonospora sp. KC213]TDC31073.1 hypothetical protein E1166_28290 [Micromonospora sp. KC213]